MKTNNCNLDKVVFALGEDALFTQIHAESSFIATSLYSAMPEKSDVTPLIITKDDSELINITLSQAFNFITTTLSAYTTEATKIDNGMYTLELMLPSSRSATIDTLIRHEMERTLITYSLAIWYEFRIPEVAQRHAKAFTASLAALRHDVLMAHRECKRPGNYI